MEKLRDTNFMDFSVISMPLYEIGAIEWYASFSNGGFPRGYAKIQIQEIIIKKHIEIIRSNQKVKTIEKLILVAQTIEL